MNVYTHSEWILHCPLVHDGDGFTMLAAPVTCPYCREVLRLTVTEQKGIEA